MGFHQIFGGCTPPKYLTDVVPSNNWGLYTPKIFDGWGAIKYLEAVHPEKNLADGVPSNISGLYTPKIFEGWGSVKYLGGLQPQNISRNHIRGNVLGGRPPKYFTDGVPSNIWGVYSPRIFDGWGSVKYLGAVQPQNI